MHEKNLCNFLGTGLIGMWFLDYGAFQALQETGEHNQSITRSRRAFVY